MPVLRTKHTRYRLRNQRAAFSLLEIILALAIFTIGLVAVGELMRLGLRNAALARDSTRAQMLCESIVAELTSQAIEATPVTDQVSENDPDWHYSIEIGSTEVTGLLAATVSVRRANSDRTTDDFTIVRWLPDPEYAAQIQAAAATTTTEQTTTGQSGAPQ